jgi:branched-subunit amino acid permease
VELGKATVCSIIFFAAKHAAALAVQDIINNLKKLLSPVAVIFLDVNVLEIVKRAEAAKRG